MIPPRKARKKTKRKPLPLPPPVVIPIKPVPRLSREQVAPGFNGTDRQFTERHGHVQIRTAPEQAMKRFKLWRISMNHMLKVFRLSEPPSVDLDHLLLAKEKDIVEMRETCDALEKIVETLKAMVEILIEKGVFTREEYLARVKR